MKFAVPLSARSAVLSSVALLGFLVLWVRLFALQVVAHDYYAAVAEENRIQLAVDIAQRGLVRDRQGRILAQNDPSYSVYLMRSKAPHVAAVIRHLANILHCDTTELATRLSESKVPAFEPVRLARHLDLETVCRIEELSELVPGAFLRYETTRKYPDPSGGAHLLGYVSEASEQPEAGSIAPGSFVGIHGAEQAFDVYLRGIDGVMYLEVTAAGQVVGSSKDHPQSFPIPGADVELTVDWELQTFATEALKSRGNGAVVCLKPATGEVLALVSYPCFDPNIFSGTLPPELWQQMSQDSTFPFLDRALKGKYPPGSTAKLITAGAGLELGIIAPNTLFAPCFGGRQIGNRYFRCWKPEGHGSLNLFGAIEQSCDVYFYQLSEKLGVENLARYARQCGLGSPTGIDLPEEAAGLVPDSAYYNSRYGRRGWTRNVVVNLGIGQGELLSTPLQIACFYGALANGGVAMRPYVLRAFQMQSGQTLPNKPHVAYQLPFSAETLGHLQRGARDVVANPHGTAHGINYRDLEIAGKTGTAQNPHGKEHAWFVGYAPFDRPEIVVAALVENAGHGSEVAAPLCAEVMRKYLGLPPPGGRPAPPVDSLSPAPTDSSRTAAGAANLLTDAH
jgi:penicillin-binding protein 2